MSDFISDKTRQVPLSSLTGGDDRCEGSNSACALCGPPTPRRWTNLQKPIKTTGLGPQSRCRKGKIQNGTKSLAAELFFGWCELSSLYCIEILFTADYSFSITRAFSCLLARATVHGKRRDRCQLFLKYIYLPGIAVRNIQTTRPGIAIRMLSSLTYRSLPDIAHVRFFLDPDFFLNLMTGALSLH